MSVRLLIAWMTITMFWWGLAFWPVSNQSPEWLARTQYVCFGTLPNGLPDTFGWMLLFGGPILLLVSILITYGSDLKEEFAALMRSKKWRPIILVLCISWIFETAWAINKIVKASGSELTRISDVDDRALPENYPQVNTPSPQISLVDQSGQTVTLDSLRGRAVIVTFAFAHCDSVCPLLLKNAMQAMERLPSDKVSAFFITLDPWRDTPSALPSMAENWKLPQNAHLLSGKVEDVNQALDAFKVPRERDQKNGNVVHPALVYILNPSGQISYAFNNPSVDWLVDGTNRIIK